MQPDDPMASAADAQTPGETDELVEQTDNRLRPDDLELEQPPQDPQWRP